VANQTLCRRKARGLPVTICGHVASYGQRFLRRRPKAGLRRADRGGKVPPPLRTVITRPAGPEPAGLSVPSAASAGRVFLAPISLSGRAPARRRRRVPAAAQLGLWRIAPAAIPVHCLGGTDTTSAKTARKEKSNACARRPAGKRGDASGCRGSWTERSRTSRSSSPWRLATSASLSAMPPSPVNFPTAACREAFHARPARPGMPGRHGCVAASGRPNLGYHPRRKPSPDGRPLAPRRVPVRIAVRLI
jgi:hypothetical protein